MLGRKLPSSLSLAAIYLSPASGAWNSDPRVRRSTRNLRISNTHKANTTAPSSGNLDLNTDKFAPITIDEALSVTAKSDWTSAFPDSRGMIPSASSTRVQLIDRMMVGVGLISEHELAEIHDIGEKMAPYHSPAAFIVASGERAVAESREDRQRRKAERKAAAEARRNLRREQVAQRRAKDIVYLGRGVSRGLADRRSNIELLLSNSLPLLSNPADLAQAIGISVSLLRWLAFHSDAPTRVHYVSFDVPKKSGGLRRLSAAASETGGSAALDSDEHFESAAVHRVCTWFCRTAFCSDQC